LLAGVVDRERLVQLILRALDQVSGAVVLIAPLLLQTVRSALLTTYGAG
jgi:hypothetical protein